MLGFYMLWALVAFLPWNNNLLVQVYFAQLYCACGDNNMGGIWLAFEGYTQGYVVGLGAGCIRRYVPRGDRSDAGMRCGVDVVEIQG